jgi:hypothetical protein
MFCSPLLYDTIIPEMENTFQKRNEFYVIDIFIDFEGGEGGLGLGLIV